MKMADYTVKHVVQWDKPINSMLVSPDGHLLALCSDMFVDVYQFHSNTFIQNFKYKAEVSTRLVSVPFFCNYNTLMAADGDNIKKWVIEKEDNDTDSNRDNNAIQE